MDGDDHRGTLGTVRNATLLLSLLAEGPAYNQLTDLAERSGMSLPTVHRLLRSLALAGLVEQDPRSLRYSLGPEIVRLSERYLDRLPTLRALSPYLREVHRVHEALDTAAGRLLLARGGPEAWAEATDGRSRPSNRDRRSWADAPFLLLGPDGDRALAEVAVP